jgi:hypothetical protein
LPLLEGFEQLNSKAVRMQPDQLPSKNTTRKLEQEMLDSFDRMDQILTNECARLRQEARKSRSCVKRCLYRQGNLSNKVQSILLGILWGVILNVYFYSFITITYKLLWRRERDSNPRWAFYTHTPLAGERLQPLGHLSVFAEMSFYSELSAAAVGETSCVRSSCLILS